MSKYVKNLVSDHVRQQLKGVNDALLVNMVGLDGNSGHRLRTELHEKQIQVLVVKNSLAARAVAGTPLAPMFDGLAGTSAICWGGQDIVSLAKEVIRLSRVERYKAFQPRGGAMEGDRLSPAQVAEVAKWPSREEQLGILVGQILGPGGRLASQILGPGGALGSQVAEKAKGAEEEAAEGIAGQQPAEAAADQPSAEGAPPA